MKASSSRGIPMGEGGRWSALVPVVALLVASCGTSAPGQRAAEFLDEKTSATITRVEEPVAFFSDDPARAANARDYLYAAPLLVNQLGKRGWWLWLGQWSTIDRGVIGATVEASDLAKVVLLVDGEPMELDVGARADSLPGISQVPYATPVATAKSFYLPLTGSQLARLGRAATVAISTETAAGDVRVWQPWTGTGNFTDLTALAAPGSAP
ncbi:MAG: hypothetical protein ABI661_00550 [Gammaproteobacteria bacterium]